MELFKNEFLMLLHHWLSLIFIQIFILMGSIKYISCFLERCLNFALVEYKSLQLMTSILT